MPIFLAILFRLLPRPFPAHQIPPQRTCVRNDGPYGQHGMLLFPLGNEPGRWPPNVFGGREWCWQDNARSTRKLIHSLKGLDPHRS